MPRHEPATSIPDFYNTQNAAYLNRQRVIYEPGTVVYFVVPVYGVSYTKCRKKVDFGLVVDNYTDGIIIQRIEPKDMRMIEGVPVKDFPAASEWRKLPKGWTWNMVLFNVEYGTLATGKNWRIDNPADIRAAYDAGILVNLQDNDHCELETEISNKFGWRIVKRYGRHASAFVSLNWRDVYDTYAGAQAIIDAEEAELKRQSELSDLEWSVELIERDIDRWAKIYSKTDLEKEGLRDFMMALDKLEDVETRVCNGNFEWKYFKNKRWTTPSVI